MTKYTAFRCPEDLLGKAKAKAKQDRRSLSNYLVMLIEKDVADMAAPAPPPEVPPDSPTPSPAPPPAAPVAPVARCPIKRQPAAKRR